MKLVDSKGMAEIDRRAQSEYSIPGILLMENAGLKAYQFLRKRLWSGGLPEGKTTFVVGKGNNGGDAMVIARQLFLDGYRGGTVIAAAEPDATQSEMCRQLGVPVIEWDDGHGAELLGGSDLIVDGLTGTGVRGALRSPLDGVVQAINQAERFTVAIDIPSGVGDEFRRGMPAVRADLTLTMGLPKLALYLPHARSLCGDIEVIELGFPPALVTDETIPGEMLTRETLDGAIPVLAPDAYKNRRGTVGIFAGAQGTAGAAVIAALGAAHSRAGLVNLFIDQSGYLAAASQLSSVMVRPVDFEASPESFESPVALTGFDSRVVGPGWGRSAGRLPWLHELLASGSGVLDADGITLLAEDSSIPRPLPHPWVLTPHPGEFSRLTGVPRDELLADPLPHLLEAAKSLGSVVVLKSHVSYIGAPDGRYWVLDGMNPALGTGGSGDLLAGIIGGFLAGGLAVEVAACAGVLVHHLAGRRAVLDRGWFTADELVPYVAQEARFDERSDWQ